MRLTPHLLLFALPTVAIALPTWGRFLNNTGSTTTVNKNITNTINNITNTINNITNTINNNSTNIVNNNSTNTDNSKSTHIGEADNIHKSIEGDNNIDSSSTETSISTSITHDDHSVSNDYAPTNSSDSRDLSVKESNNKDNSKRPMLIGSLLDGANVTVEPLTGDSPLVAGPLLSLPSLPSLPSLMA
ncbi:hypothetical protein ETB97_002217 [Aspergillus alliaceus]|uniref:Uncharacterized protein n=1 Tax=Petromyces alliaceus TaxID=209559 RepID=A0A8H6A5T8_PETAA|nr:hypothetical protein ETB97_002217 [Aspergillus burnettii]